MSAWRKTTSTRQGTATIYGAADFNVLMDLLNGLNTGQPVNINNAWNFVIAPTGNIVADGAITSAKIANGAIVDADINAAAAIAYSKLNLANSVTGTDIAANTITDADISATAGIQKTKLNFGAGIVNADISSAAAIAYSKLALGTSIVNTDIATAAAIAYSKLALSNSIVNADINSAAALAYSKLALSNSIVNADINSAAAIAKSKLAALAIVDSDVTGPISHSKIGTNLIFSETGLTAPRTVTWPDATGKGVYEDNATTITNKTVGYRDNNLKNVRAMYHIREFGLASAVQGAAVPAATGLLSGSSVLANGTGTVVNDAANGHYLSTACTANAQGPEVWTGSNVTARCLNFRLRSAIGVNAADSTGRLWVAVGTTLPPGNSDPSPLIPNTTSGVYVGSRSTDANILVFYNDGTGAAPASIDSGVTKGNDTNLRHIEIIASDSAPNFKVYIDGTLITTLTTRIPASTTGMLVTALCGGSSATAVTGKFQFLEIEQFGSRIANWATDLPYAS